MWSLAGIAVMMSDDPDVTETVVLDHITVILNMGQQSASKGLTEEKD